MKNLLCIGLFALLTLNVSSQKIMFLHHSTGGGVINSGDVYQWFNTYNESHGTTYTFSNMPYPYTPYPWSNYPYDYWNLWINGECDNDNVNIACLDRLSAENDIVIFKHCYPGAQIIADNGEPSVSSDVKTIQNYQLQYRALRELMDSYPDTRFIVWTLVPLHRLATNQDNAQRAREFVDWVKYTWLTEDGNSHPNIEIFDFFGLSAEHNPSPENGAYNCLRYDYEKDHSEGDSHPNDLANQDIGPVFCQFIVNAIEDASLNDVTPPTVPKDLRVLSISGDSVSLGWSASVDNKEVEAYYVFRGGILLDSVKEAFYQDAGIEQGESYQYSVAAKDISGNMSEKSSPVDAFISTASSSMEIRSFQITPNPSSGLLNIALPGYFKDATIFIYEASGKMVCRKEIAEFEGSFDLNLSFLTGGFYIARIECGNLNKVSRFIISH